ncbi:MAG: methyltransferase domain-containing protein [Armatimonadota bacterium]|nr:methyltransferase domain-containing protein [Armatimonadota bacterium]MDR7495805.1 methyltransferase domain-containing protein [Armatimonadota bacterium]
MGAVASAARGGPFARPRRWIGGAARPRRGFGLPLCERRPPPRRDRLARGGRRNTLPFTNGIFDVVLSCDSLEHFHDPLAALREVERVLKPAGRILV